MPCNCHSNSPILPEKPDLPTLAEVKSGCDSCRSPDSDPSADVSQGSCGTTLDLSFTDATCDDQNKGITILGRIGRTLARFKGDGFIQILNGRAFVVKNIPFKVSTLWHERILPGAYAIRSVLGKPMPFKRLGIFDDQGNPHMIEGPEVNAIPHWNAEAGIFEIKPVSEIQKCVKGQIEGSDAVELVGFEAIPVSGESDAVRCMKKLSGAGILIAKQVATTPSECVCEGCEPVAAVATIFQFLPNPTTGTNYKLRYSAVTGLHSWVADP